MNFLKTDGLLSRCVRGGAILATGSVVAQGIRFLRNMILTRLLAPEHFGIMLFVMTTSQLFQTFTEVGIQQSVIQNKLGATKEYLNVAWWFSMVRGVGLYILGWFAAPLMAYIYKEPQLTPLLRVAFIAIFLQGLISPGLFVLEKQLKFVKVVFVTQGAGLTGTIASLALVFVYPNVWALVMGLVAEAGFRCVGSFLVYPIRPRWQFDRPSTRELFRFSRGMVGLPILTFIFLKADVFVLKWLGTNEILGFYSMALFLASLPDLFFSYTIRPMILPVFSEMQDQKERLQLNILRMTKGLYLLGLPLILCLAVFSHPILAVTWGEDYAQVHGAYALLSIYIIFYLAGSVVCSVYLAIGRPELHRRFTILRVILMVLCIYPAINWLGATGAAAAKLGCLILAGVWQLFNLKSLLDLPIHRYLNSARVGLYLTALIVLPALAWKYWINNDWLEVIGGIILCGLAWTIGLWSLRDEIKHKLLGTKTPVLVD